MNYELALKLKEAGFPQENNIAMVFQDKKTSDLFISTHNGLAEHNGKDFEIMPYTPTLSELIEACGDKFNDLSHSGMEWYARSGLSIIVSGSTPEEAVARLWLALNKK